jgi:hypothetical protein
LSALGLSQEIENMPGHHILTQAGLALLAKTEGIDPQSLNSYTGAPTRAFIYRQQKAHTARIFQFMTWVAKSGLMLSWSMNAARLYFYDIELAWERIPRLCIVPDSIGHLLYRDRVHEYWLEVDRGTRFGRRLEGNLARYFQVFFAGRCSFKPAPVIYIAENARGSGEARLRYIVSKFRALSGRYPGTPVKILLTTGELIDQQAHRSLEDARIWRVFSGSGWQGELLRLLEAMEAG